MTRINIEHKDSCLGPRCNADVCVRILRPPSTDLFAISGRVLDAVNRLGMFASAHTIVAFWAGTPPVLDMVERYNGPASSGISEGQLFSDARFLHNVYRFH
jgi:hypothetical protein